MSLLSPTSVKQVDDKYTEIEILTVCMHVITRCQYTCYTVYGKYLAGKNFGKLYRQRILASKKNLANMLVSGYADIFSVHLNIGEW